MDYGIYDVLCHTPFKTTGWVIWLQAPKDKPPLMGGTYSGGLWNALWKVANFAHMLPHLPLFEQLEHSELLQALEHLKEREIRISRSIFEYYS